MLSRKDLWNYFFILIITIILRNAGFSLIFYAPIILKCIFILFFAFVAVSYFYECKSISTPDLLLVLGISLCTLFLLMDTFLLSILIVFLIVIIPVMARSEGNKVVRIIVLFFSSLTILVSILVLAFSLMLRDFGRTVETGNILSPNKNFSIVSEYIDQGALGGNYVANVKCSLLGVIQWKRKIYIGRLGKKPNIKWAGNYTVIVNGNEQNIFLGRIIDTR